MEVCSSIYAASLMDTSRGANLDSLMEMCRCVHVASFMAVYRLDYIACLKEGYRRVNNQQSYISV
jgi:hypothetical protein